MNEIEQFYDQSAYYEWGRLERHRTEFAVTLRVMEEYLPPPPARILDVGGGPGRYALHLAAQGYEVTLVDLSSNLLEFAKQKSQESGTALADYVHANALNLDRLEPAYYDAVLLMGPLYHLIDLEQRRRAVQEVKHVLKSGGEIFASFITRYAPLRDAAKYDPARIINKAAQHKEILETGVHRHPEAGGFTYAYFAHPSEIKPFMEEAGFKTLDLVACEGVVSMIEEKINELTGDLWDAWVDLNYRLGKDSTVHGTAEHLLYVGWNTT